MDTLSILRTSKTISAEASRILYARSSFKFDPADCEAHSLGAGPPLDVYKRIRNLRIIIDYASEFMSDVGKNVHDLRSHVLCILAEVGPVVDSQAIALVRFREKVLYAFFLNLSEPNQALKTFTLCLKITSNDSLARLLDNSIEDPLVATDFVRTLTLLVHLRKVVIELNGKFVLPDSKHSGAFLESQLFQRLSNFLGPCIEEIFAQDIKRETSFFKRFAFFPAAFWLSEEEY